MPASSPSIVLVLADVAGECQRGKAPAQAELRPPTCAGTSRVNRSILPTTDNWCWQLTTDTGNFIPRKSDTTASVQEKVRSQLLTN